MRYSAEMGEGEPPARLFLSFAGMSGRRVWDINQFFFLLILVFITNVVTSLTCSLMTVWCWVNLFVPKIPFVFLADTWHVTLHKNKTDTESAFIVWFTSNQTIRKIGLIDYVLSVILALLNDKQFTDLLRELQDSEKLCKNDT